MSTSDPYPLLPGPGDHRIFADRALLQQEILPGYITRCRWFGGKARRPRRFFLRDLVPLGASRLAFVEIEYEEGAPDTYLLPLLVVAGPAAEALIRTASAAVVARFADGAVLGDALHDETFRSALFDLMAAGGAFDGEQGRVAGAPGAVLGHHPVAPPSRALGVEQSNSSIIYGDHIFLKLYRRIEEGVNPDAEILRFLGARSFPYVPPFGGAVEYRGIRGGTRILALALGLMPNDGDAWSFTLRHLAQFFAHLLAKDAMNAAALEADYLAHAAQLGTRTGELHLALSDDATAPGFSPEPLAEDDLATLGSAISASVGQVGLLIARRFSSLDSATRGLAQDVMELSSAMFARARTLPKLATHAAKTRTHGDYHLGQVLHGTEGFIIIDFEGEPMRPLAERRRKMSPFRDVAGMLRSFHYAAHAALEPLGAARAQLAADAGIWARHAQQTFLDAWLATTHGAVFRDPDPTAERTLLDAFLLEKALYEIRYEVNNRPTWLGIPLRGVLALLEEN